MLAAATSSETSPGSSRTTTTSLTPALVERRDLGRADRGAFLEHQQALPQRMHGDAANRVGRTGGTELHAACSFAVSSAAAARAVISAMIETAISDGDTAPMRKPDRRMDARDVGIRRALRLQPLRSLGVGLSRAQCADIEAIAFEGVQQRRIVDLGIVRHRDERRVMIDVERRQRDIRPFGDQRHVGKALGTGERRARIDHRDVIVKRTRQRRQRLADMDRADDDQPRGRRMDVEEQLLAAALDHAALAHAQLL